MKIENRVALLEAQNKMVLHVNASLQMAMQRQQEIKKLEEDYKSLVAKVESEEGVKLDSNTLKEVDGEGNTVEGG